MCLRACPCYFGFDLLLLLLLLLFFIINIYYCYINIIISSFDWSCVCCAATTSHTHTNPTSQHTKHNTKMACLNTLKLEIKTLERIFPKTHDRFRILHASVDELTCRFIGKNGKNYDIHANITVSRITKNSLPPFTFRSVLVHCFK